MLCVRVHHRRALMPLDWSTTTALATRWQDETRRYVAAISDYGAALVAPHPLGRAVGCRGRECSAGLAVVSVLATRFTATWTFQLEMPAHVTPVAGTPPRIR